ncbi:uncharacterized protein LOC126329586 [Schistocerca gregaria]|uniref:uncharacterized protein LOC126329586 n=1 Tax=Schistocerca gregaria TaxID=7010 RepID=UPI00211EB9A3|nr:uncharacterized protein LOC126329586 [Schistocerca gregaria]
MPTVVLVDNSGILDTVVRDRTTIKDILQQGVRFFLKEFSDKNKMDVIAAVPIDGSETFIMDFTQEVKPSTFTLDEVKRSKLACIDVRRGLDTAIRICMDQFGRHVSVHFVLFSWIDHTFTETPALAVPFDCKVHVLGYGHFQEGNAKPNPLRELANSCSGFFSYYSVRSPTQSLDSKIKSLFEQHYAPHNCHLVMGHVSSPVLLVPNPNVSLWSQLAARHRLCLEFPSILSIIGFIHQRWSFSLPSVTRFVLFPSEADCHEQTASPPVPSPFLFLLHNLLVRTKKAAAVRLDKCWYGLIHVSHKSRKLASSHHLPPQESSGPAEISSVLLLTVLCRHSSLEWIGRLDRLVLDKIQSDSLSKHQALHHLPLTLKEPWPSYNPSLQDEDSFIFAAADPGMLQLEVSRLHAFIADLPNQCADVFKQLERIRILAKAYHLDNLLEAITARLVSDMNRRSSTTLTGRILQHLHKVVQDKMEPIEWTASDEDAIMKAYSKFKERNLKPSAPPKKTTHCRRRAVAYKSPSLPSTLFSINLTHTTIQRIPPPLQKGADDDGAQCTFFFLGRAFHTHASRQIECGAPCSLCERWTRVLLRAALSRALAFVEDHPPRRCFPRRCDDTRNACAPNSAAPLISNS